MEIFNTSRIRFYELYKDALSFISQTYTNLSQQFTMASPMGQLLQVILGLGRMIMYFIEDSITELNINTASRSSSIKGLTTLTGHNPSRSMAARGLLKLTYKPGAKLDDGLGTTIIIPKYTKLSSSINGLTYTILLPGEEVRLSLTSPTDTIVVNIIQGTLEYQQATGTGEALQSFNFRSKKGASIDNYFVNIYVDGRLWPIYSSILDMVYNENSCLVKTGQTGGIDVFFGNGYNGKIPPAGSVIMAEYLITDGGSGNINTNDANIINNWKFLTSGYSLNGEKVDLNKVLNVSIYKDILFGTPDEPLYLTRLLTPNVSRSFVLANTNNYIYFLRKLNIFSIIDAIPGYSTFNDTFYSNKYNVEKTKLENLNQELLRARTLTGNNTEQINLLVAEINEQYIVVRDIETKLNNARKDDNTVYLFLIPDISKKITSGENYFSCNINTFKLTDNEKEAILDLIEESGQRVLTVDNAILDIFYPRFCVNMSLVTYEGFDIDTIKETIISTISDYFIKNTRRDRIPRSDLIKIVEAIEGVDSVNIWFDASSLNKNIYGDYKTYNSMGYDRKYGLDKYGDILLDRIILDAFGNEVYIKDVYPIIRGGFVNKNGKTYYDTTAYTQPGSINIEIRGTSKVDYNSLSNIALVKSLQ
jgi:hypothetical protein